MLLVRLHVVPCNWLALTIAVMGGWTCGGPEGAFGLQDLAQSVSLVIEPQADTVPSVGDRLTLRASIRDGQGRVVNVIPAWRSLDPAVATVFENGEVLGLAEGSARIAASHGRAADTAAIHVAPSGSWAMLTVTVSHSPAAPTASDPVTIAARASDPAAVSSLSISVDGKVVETCPEAACAYTRIFALGSYTYAASATDTAGKVTDAEPGSFAVRPPTSGSTPPGSPTSPHWPHARFAAIDYRIYWLKDAQQQAQEWDQVAARYDVAIGGQVDQWKKRNPTVRQYVYDLIVGERQQDVGPMENWLTANGYEVENAYLHVAGTSKTKANRISYFQWTDDYWLLNPADPGEIAWREHITKSLTAVRPSGFRFDGLFFDVLGGGKNGPEGHPNGPSLEYASKAAYLPDLHTMLSKHRGWVPGGINLANTGNYVAPEEVLQTNAAGGAVMEFSNDIYNEGAYTMWGYVADRMAAGTPIVLTPQRNGPLKNTPRYNMNPGNYSTVAERVLLAEYANYLMMVDPANMDMLAVDFYLTGSLNPAEPHDITWLKAYQVDIGPAVGPRALVKSGTDGAGQQYKAFQREFANALVVYRPLITWSFTDFGDGTAVTLDLPGGHTWRMLLPDGSLSGPMTSVQLRNAEAAIFMKG